MTGSVCKENCSTFSKRRADKVDSRWLVAGALRPVLSWEF